MGRWVDDEHVIALIDQTLGVWNLVSGQRVYAIGGIDPRSVPALSGGRRYVAVPAAGSVQLHSTVDGRSLGRMESDGQVAGVSFSPDGKTLAIITPRRLQIWDLPTGTVSSEVASRVSLATGSPIWISTDLVLSNNGVLLSTFRGLPLWRYEIAGSKCAAVGRHVAILRRHPTTEFCVVSLPHPSAAESIRGVRPGAR